VTIQGGQSPTLNAECAEKGRPKYEQNVFGKWRGLLQSQGKAKPNLVAMQLQLERPAPHTPQRSRR